MSTRGTLKSSLRKHIQTELDFRSEYRSEINARARRVAILNGFIVHYEIIMSILSSDNSDGQEGGGEERNRGRSGVKKREVQWGWFVKRQRG
jgi:hypothetical protein